MRERVALALLLLLGAWLRVRHVGGAHLFGDELHSLPALGLPWRRVLAAFDMEGSGLALPLLQRLALELLGPSLVALRLPALLPAVAALLLLPLLARSVVSRNGALFATALLSASGFLAFYARFARSYSLVLLLALVFTWAACRLADEAAPEAGWYVALGLSGGLLPWAHLSALAFVAATGAAALLAVAAAPATRGRLLPLATSLGGAALLALALHLPAAPRVLAFVTQKQDERYEGRFGPLDVAMLMAGGRLAGLLLTLLVLAGAGLLLRARGRRALPLVVAALAPVPLVFAAGPYGDPYAYARYAIAALPAAFLLAGEILGRGLHAMGPAAARLAPLLAPALAIGLAARGPLGAVEAGPYANSYLELQPLAAFDAPFPELPAAYPALAPGSVIIETPALVNRSRQLYRNYYLQHRHPTLLGFLPEEGEAPPGPHVSLREPRRLADRADYLLVHRDPEAEVTRYWQFVYGVAWPRLGGSRVLMERQADWGRPLPRPAPELIERLRRHFGPPLVEDDALLLFRLR